MKQIVFPLNGLIDYPKRQISSRTLSAALGTKLPIVLYAADVGESISSEQTTATKFIHVIDGELDVLMEGTTYHLKTADLITIAPTVFHELRAVKRCKFLQLESNE